MSIEAMSYVLNCNVGDPTRKLVLLGYANHAKKDGTAAWPSVDTIAEYANCSRRTAQRNLAVLLAEGWIREGDQELLSHIEKRYRPIVYDLSMTDDQRGEWRAAYEAGEVGEVRASAAEIGAVYGAKSAEKAAAKKAAQTTPVDTETSRGVSLTPLPGGGTETTRGDSLTPLPDGVRGVTGDASGVSPVTSRGVTGVTQTVLEPSEGTVQTTPPSPAASSSPADAVDGEGELTFEAFWRVYPRRAGKIDARRAWDRAVRDTHPGTILAGARRFAADPNLPGKDEERFIPHPATWIKRGGWDDEPLPARTRGRGVGYENDTWDQRVADTASLAPPEPVEDPDELRRIFGTGNSA